MIIRPYGDATDRPCLGLPVFISIEFFPFILLASPPVSPCGCACNATIPVVQDGVGANNYSPLRVRSKESGVKREKDIVRHDAKKM